MSERTKERKNMKSIDKSIEILVEKVKLALREYNGGKNISSTKRESERERGRAKTTTERCVV